MKRIVLAVAMLVVAMLLATPVALAGGPGKWTRISAAGLTIDRQVSLARTPDGLLHVAWSGPAYAATDILQRPITPSGALGAQTTVASGLISVDDPLLLYSPADSALWTFFCGMVSDQDGLWYSRLQSPWDASWSAPTLATSAGSAYAGSPSVIEGNGGAFFEAWATDYGVYVHRGLSPDDPAYEYNNASLGGVGYDANLAQDAAGSGALWLAWYRLADATHPGNEGLFVSLVDPSTGAPVGVPYRLPGSATSKGFNPMTITRVPIVAGSASGVYVAYPTGYPTHTGVRLWRLSAGATGDAPVASSVAVAVGKAAKEDVALAATPDNRVWVLWAQKSGSRTTICARRSNPGATLWGAVTTVAAPVGTTAVWRLAANAQARRVDVVAYLERGSTDAIWHTQLQPGFSVAVSPKTLRAGATRAVLVTVKDAGVPVVKAKVRLGGKSGYTNAAGKVKLKVGSLRRGSAKVLVSKTGYKAAVLNLRVK